MVTKPERRKLMTRDDIILHIFYLVATSLPERTRLERLLTPALAGGARETNQDWCSSLFADPTFFTVIDSYPIGLIFPIREGRSEQQVGKKGRDKGRWSVGIKFCWLLNEFCRVVAWDWATMNVYGKHFHPIVKPFIGKTIVLADYGFRDKDGVPENMKICKKGTWNERMCVETTLSMVTMVCDLKRIRNRLAKSIQARLARDCLSRKRWGVGRDSKDARRRTPSQKFNT
jgi:hypothetical protein